MTSLTLALDNDVSENTEQISKLFPKCRPRSDINLNPIIHSGRENECMDNSSITVMNVERDNDRYSFCVCFHFYLRFVFQVGGGRFLHRE